MVFQHCGRHLTGSCQMLPYLCKPTKAVKFYNLWHQRWYFIIMTSVWQWLVRCHLTCANPPTLLSFTIFSTKGGISMLWSTSYRELSDATTLSVFVRSSNHTVLYNVIYCWSSGWYILHILKVDISLPFFLQFPDGYHPLWYKGKYCPRVLMVGHHEKQISIKVSNILWAHCCISLVMRLGHIDFVYILSLYTVNYILENYIILP